jgi:ureidoacrylate peracid hydrolase
LAMTIDDLVDPRHTALIVVDMQNDFCASNGALAESGADPGLIQAMAPRLLSLIAVARAIHLPIIHVRTEHSAWTNSAPWVGRLNGRPRSACFPASWGADYYPGFEPRLDAQREPGGHEFVVTKHRYSGFVGTELDLVLRSHDIRTVIMTGEATNVCVESTARDAFMRDYWVVFVSDCTAAAVQAAHDATLYTMGKHFGKVVSAQELVGAWGGAAQAAWRPAATEPAKDAAASLAG